MKNGLDMLGYSLIIFIIAAIAKMYYESDAYNLKCIVSTVDGNKYCVREREKLEETADLLARVTGKLKKLVKITYKKHPNNLSNS